jgi:hypothetical protein
MAGRPKDYAWIMPEEWKLRVKTKLKDLGWTQEMLAERVGMSPANMTHTLAPLDQGGYRSSTFAPRIAAATGIVLPGAPLDDQTAEVVELLAELRLLSEPLHDEMLRVIRESRDDQRALLGKLRKRRHLK